MLLARQQQRGRLKRHLHRRVASPPSGDAAGCPISSRENPEFPFAQILDYPGTKATRQGPQGD